MGSILNWLCNIVHYSFVVALVWSACVFFLKALLFWGWINPARQNKQCCIRSSFVKTKWQIHVGVMCYLENEHVTVLTVLCEPPLLVLWRAPLSLVFLVWRISFFGLLSVGFNKIVQCIMISSDRFWTFLWRNFIAGPWAFYGSSTPILVYFSSGTHLGDWSRFKTASICMYWSLTTQLVKSSDFQL